MSRNPFPSDSVPNGHSPVHKPASQSQRLRKRPKSGEDQLIGPKEYRKKQKKKREREAKWPSHGQTREERGGLINS